MVIHVERITLIIKVIFKTLMLKLDLRDYSGVYPLFKGTIIVANTTKEGAAANNSNEKVILKYPILYPT